MREGHAKGRQGTEGCAKGMRKVGRVRRAARRGQPLTTYSPMEGALWRRPLPHPSRPSHPLEAHRLSIESLV